MQLKGNKCTQKKLLCLIMYYAFACYLPVSYFPVVGGFSKWLRYHLCRVIFCRCGKNVNIERLASFGSGLGIEIGDNSGLGIRCVIPANTVIGRDVMMGPNCYILGINHRFDDLDTPMNKQGHSQAKQCVIGDDVWIGRDVLMTPGRKIAMEQLSLPVRLFARIFRPFRS